MQFWRSTGKTPITKMGANYNTKTLHCNRMYSMQSKTKCLQINLQRSRVAMDNLMKITEEDRMGIICIQESYAIHNKIVGIPKKHKIFVSGEGRHRAAIVVTNK